MEVQTFCRFCAEFKPISKLNNLQSDLSLCKEIKLKVKFIQAHFVNLWVGGNYPAAVCFVCKEALDQEYTFFKKVKEAQEVVSDLLTNPELFKIASEHSTVVEESSIKYESPKNILPEEVIPEIPEEVISEEVIPETQFSEEEIDEFDNSIDESLDTTQQNEDDDNTSEKSLPQIEKDKSTDDNLKPKSWNQICWICACCNNEFSDLQSLRTHSISTHNICQAFKCPECRTNFRTKGFNAFIRHVRKHYAPLRKCCIHCNLQCKTVKKMLAHLTDHLRDKQFCGSCGDVFDNEEELQKHRIAYTKMRINTVLKRTCKICHTVFRSTPCLKWHMACHEELNPRAAYECDHCGKLFRSKGPLIRHLKSLGKKAFGCKICKKTFKVRAKLIVHIKRHIKGAKMFQCDECGKSYESMYHLNEHKLMHSGEMPFSCVVCKKQFRRKTYVTRHMLQHTGEKPYACHFCDKTFTDLGNKNKHMKRIHKKVTVKKTFKVIENPTEEIQKWKDKIMKERFTQ